MGLSIEPSDWKVQSCIGDAMELTLLVAEPTLYADKPMQFAALHVTAMRRLSLERFELMLIEGKKGSRTALACVSVESGSLDRIEMHEIARDNLRVKVGDRVSVRRSPSDEHGKSIIVLPLESCYQHTNGRMEEHLKAYCDQAARRLLPFHQGDIFVVQNTMRFKVVQTDPPGFCTLTNNTKVELGTGYHDIGGCKQQINQIREWVEVPLCRPELFKAIGAKPPSGVLLVGQPGVGKSRVARAVANHAGASLILVTAAEIMSNIVGESGRRLRATFEKAKNLNGTRALIFINDIEFIAPKPNKSSGSGNHLSAQLLSLMDDVRNYSSIVVLAATSLPGSIDPALRRFGRFDREIKFTGPDALGRLEILRIQTRTMRLADDVDLGIIAAATHGYVGADLASLCAEAASHHIRNKVSLDDSNLSDDILGPLLVDMEDFQFALSNCPPLALRENPILNMSQVKWNDIGGLDDTIQDLREMVMFPIKHAEKFQHFGLPPTTGVLLYGPPGTGKTLLAKAVACESGLNFISVKGPELLSMWYGESEANVRKLFDQARAVAPCIIFFDELDSLTKPRGSCMGDSGASDRVLNQLLVEMDGISGRKNVFVIGATNRPDQVDPALLRPGRFDRLLHVSLPDEDARHSILKTLLHTSPGSTVPPEADLRWIASITPGFSGADLMGVCRRALELYIRSIDKGGEPKHRGQDGPSENFAFITRHNLEEAMRGLHRSVSEETASRYGVF